LADRGDIPAKSQEEPSSDGRRRRSQRSRERILHALAEALSEPDIELTPEQLAARSGYSISTIFRHFGDQAGLTRAMRGLVLSRVQTILGAGPFEGSVSERVKELVRRCGAVFETVGPFIRTMSRNRYAVDEEGPRTQQMDRVVRGQIIEALGEELDSRRDTTEEIVAAVLSAGTWAHMRGAQGHTPEAATELLESAVLRLLGEGP
jgi:AcrR family transcriptional regulator